MKYMLLIYDNEATAPQPDDEEMGRWFALDEEMREAGVVVAGEALHPTQAATTVRVKNGETVTTDGPFAEAREQLGGFYLIDVEDLDAAIAWAAKMPNADRGSIEVRPAVDFEAGG